MSFRTDEHNNPTAFTIDIARTAGLEKDKDFTIGKAFTTLGHTFFTAKLLTTDPVGMTIKVIDKISFYTNVTGTQRWDYIGIPPFIWHELSYQNKVKIIQFMYHREGGTVLEPLFKPGKEITVNVSDSVKVQDKV